MFSQQKTSTGNLEFAELDGKSTFSIIASKLPLILTLFLIAKIIDIADCCYHKRCVRKIQIVVENLRTDGKFIY